MGIPNRELMRAALELRQGKALTECFARGCVAVCGLGGLGSNIAISLARSGVGKLILIDFDCVDVTNLHRQQYRAAQVGLPKTDALRQIIGEIAPYVEVETHAQRVTAQNCAELIRDANIVCEAFDGAQEKAMLANTVLETMPEKYLVAASGMAGLDSANAVQTRRVAKRFYICGDGVSDVADGIGLVAPRVMLCAAHQAHMVLRILAQQYDV